MNKLFLSLLGASIAALVLAIGCGTWLFLQSWEEGKRLERQNRELLASLEASRVRLENFCEYPVEALCNLEEPRGTVSSVMGGMENAVPLPEPSLPAPENIPHQENVTPSSVSTPSSGMSRDEGKASPPPSPAAQTAVTPSPQGVSTPLPIPAGTEKQEEASNDTNMTAERPAASTEYVGKITWLEDQDAEDAEDAPTAAAAANAPDAPATVDAPNAPATATAPATADELPKKTWITLETDRVAMTLRIAGEGTSLEARGELLQDPLRYEVTLKGAWKIYNRHPSTKLVKDLQIRPSGENTLLVFELNDQPGQCEVTQEDPRTIAVTIR